MAAADPRNRIAALKLDLRERDAEIARVREEYDRLRQKAERERSGTVSAGIEQLARRLAPLLSQLATMQSLAEGDRPVRVEDVLKLFGKLKRVLNEAGLVLQGAALQTFRGTLRMLDEVTACILGYDTRVREDQVYVVFDFGGGTLDVSVVKIRDLAAGEEIGGSLIDQWLLGELQKAGNLTQQDLADVGTALLRGVEEAKVALSGGAESFEVEQFNDLTARLISHTYTAEGLRRTGCAAPRFGRTESEPARGAHRGAALEQARDRYGARKSEVRAVFMAGGSSLLLGVAGVIGNLFPDCPVHCEDPFEAIARGACRYAGEDINLSLVHDYCVRAWNPGRKDYVLVTVAPKGTRYPSEGPVSTKFVNAACEGAGKLGMVVVENAPRCCGRRGPTGWKAVR